MPVDARAVRARSPILDPDGAVPHASGEREEDVRWMASPEEDP